MNVEMQKRQAIFDAREDVRMFRIKAQEARNKGNFSEVIFWDDQLIDLWEKEVGQKGSRAEALI